MKTLIQLFLFFTIIILSFFFYKNYFDLNNKKKLTISNEKFEFSNKTEKSDIIDINKKENVNEEITSKDKEKAEKTNSSIQNLSYHLLLMRVLQYIQNMINFQSHL